MILREARPRNLFGVFVALYNYYLAASGKERWGCKSTFMIDHTRTILEHFPAAKLIWLIRDPRDVAASSRKSVFNPFHPYFTARLWNQQQRIGLSLMERLSPETILSVRYEDLIENPAATVKRLCGFLGEPYEEGMLRFFETREARKSGSLSQSWSNTARPILADNAGKYRQELSQEEIYRVEALAGEVMERLGYERCYLPSADSEVSPLQIWQYRFLDWLWRFQAELRSWRWDRNHWRRWARGILIAYLSLRRWTPGSYLREAAEV